MSEPIQNDVGVMLMEISTALNALADSIAVSDPRIQPAAELLGKINTEWRTNPVQAKIDANSLAVQINALLRSNPQNSRLADAADAAEQLAGTWSGDDYA